MRKKELIINLSFLAAVLPIVYSIFLAYANLQKGNNYINYANPLNLQIENVMVTQDYIDLVLYNPNNFTVGIVIDLIGIRNSLGSAAPLTSGGDIGIIKNIKPYSTVNLHFDILRAYTDPRRVILQWLRMGGNLTIVLHYTEVTSRKTGTIITIVKK